MPRKIVLLEGLRGFSAIIVLIGHIIGKLPISIFKTHLIFNLIGSWGTEAVIIFFVLSGLVIGNSYKNKHQNSRQFIQSRLLRILPIYFVGIILAIISEPLYYDSINFKNVIGSIFFLSTLQGYISSPVEFNAPIWSLTFEMFFYLIFSLSLHRKHNLFMNIWLIISIISIPLYFYPQFNNGIILHCIAMISFSSIWLVGYYIMKYYDKFEFTFYNAALSILSLPLISRLHFFDNYYDVLKFLLFAVVSIPLFGFAIKNKMGISKINGLFYCQVIFILFCILHLLLFSTSLLLSKLIYISLPFVCFFIFPLKMKLLIVFKKLKSIFLFFGELSYSIYILHYPIIFILALLLKSHLYVALFIIPLVIMPIAFIMESKYQPMIVRFCKSYLKF